MPDKLVIDKSQWGPGPWQDEPDRVEFEHAGLPCLLLRSRHGNWCGYTAVPPDHPLHGKKYEDVDVGVHGGLTFSGGCKGAICHVPKPGEPDNVWWFGFDLAHAFDFCPGMAALLRSLPPIAESTAQYPIPEEMRDVYRDVAYARAETERLAEQLVQYGAL